MVRVLFLFLFLGLGLPALAGERYILQKSFQENGGDSVTEVYLDTVLQRLIIKEFDVASGSPERPTSSGQRRISEAWSPSPQGWGLRRVSDFDLKNRTGQERAREALSSLSDSEGPTLHNQNLSNLRTGNSRYRLLQVGQRENTQVGVYFNDYTGEVVFQSVSNKGANPHTFPRTAGLLTDLQNVGSDQTPLHFETMPVKTMDQFLKATDMVGQKMQEHGFRLPDGAFNPIREIMDNYNRTMNRIHLRESSSGVFEEVLYHPITHELLFRQYSYRDDGSQEVIDETFFDLNDDVGFQAALVRFRGMGAEGEGVKDNLLALTEGCERPLSESGALTRTAERNLEDINAVMESLWRSQLQGGLPERIQAGRDNTFDIEFELLGRKHPLVGNLDQYGNLIDLNFRNPELARDKKMRIRHIVGSNGKKQFMVEALNETTGEYEAQLVLEGETGFHPETRRLQPRLAAYLRGQQGEGQFNFDGFEKSIYALNMNQGRLASIEPRFRFDGQRSDPYRNVSFKREGSGGLVNFAFHFFFSQNGRREKVRDTILEEARKAINSTEYGQLVTDYDIERVANEVTQATSLRTENFKHSKNRIEAVATEEAYSRYGQLILTRIVSDLIPDEREGNISDMINVVMRDFRLCLKKASDARNSEMASECMDIFMREAPIDVAKEILKLKLAQAGLGDFSEVAEKDYLACIQENYDPIKLRETSDGNISVIQGCLYKSLITTVDKVAPALIDEKVGEISRELNLNLSYSQERLARTRSQVRQCLRDEGLAYHGARGYSTNLATLGSMKADIFEQGFMTCMNLLVEDVALNVGEVALKANLSRVDLTDEAKQRVVDASFEPGMQNCIDAQKRTISQVRERYRQEKARRQATVVGNRDVRVPFQVPSFDPLECNRVLTNIATGNSTIETLKAMLGENRYRQILAADSKDPFACFENIHKDLIERTGVWIVENTSLSKEKIKEEQQKRDADTEGRTANCLKEAVSMMSYYVAQDVVLEKLAENPEYKDITLSDSVKAKIGASVRSCFNEKLAGFDNVDDILVQQERLKDICGAELLKDPNVAPELFAPFVEAAISKVNMSEETREKVVGSVVSELIVKMRDARDIDQAMAIVDSFKKDAVPLVLRGVVSEKIINLTKANSPAEIQEVEDLVNLVQQEIFGADGQGALGQELIRALDSEEEGALDAVILKIESRAAQILGPEILKRKAQQMLADGVLESQEDVDIVVEQGGAYLIACLERAQEEKRENPIEYCEVETTISTTEVILRAKLKEKLDGHPLIGDILNEEEKKELEARLITPERMARLREITGMEEGAAKDKAMDTFVLQFKVDATESVFSKAIAGIVESKLPNPKYFQERDKQVLDELRASIAQQGRVEMRNCLEPVKAEMAKPDHQMTELDLDECLNKVRKQASLDILPKRLEFILNYLHGDQQRVARLVQGAVNNFSQCAENKDIKTDGKAYGNYLDGCLMVTISDFVGSIVQDMREGEPALLSGGPNAADWNKCRENLKERAAKHVYGDQMIPETLSQMNDANFYAELYKIGEALNPQRAPNIDWLEPNLIQCAVEKMAPEAILEFRNSYIQRHGGELDEKTQDFVMRLTDVANRIFSLRRADGSPVVIDLDPLFGKPNEEKAPMIGAENAPATSRPTPIMDILKEFEPKVNEYLAMIAAYDPDGMNEAIAKFESEVAPILQQGEGEVPLETAADLLLNSDLADILIESLIAGLVREKTLEALEKEGADTSVVWILSDKEMIHRLFGSGEGKLALERMKREYLKPIMTGETSSFEIPSEVMKDITDVLIKDTQLDGFVETLFGPIIQKKLDDKRDWIESGWTSIFKMAGAGWMGLNRHRDFTWGNIYVAPNEQYELRYTNSGKQATVQFAQRILGPMLNNNLSEEDLERESEALEDLVRKAMDENG